MKRVCSILNDLQRFWASADKVIEICYDMPIICDRAGAVDKPERFDGKIEFKNVSFKYKNDWVLRNVSFRIESGQTVGIIGPTGSGKSTIASLIARFYDVNEGEVMLDGRDVRYRTLESIHRAVSIATQEVFLFSDTIDSNIAFCNVDMEEEQVFECAQLACADGFIRKMPEGYQTIVGERGVGLSGGQRQRIALARAIAAIPAVLILDDTTSAVDMETEKQMQYNLNHLPFHCTKIIIAQRITSIRQADQIFVLENGNIDVGTHDSLARTNRYYRDVCELQDVDHLPPFEGVQGKVNR
jgi:ATP-binding cassette subfamily B protein